jgi:hypothetical protein
MSTTKDLGKELLEIREEIDKRKTKKSEQEGALKIYYNRLKTEFGCNTIDEAEEYIEKLSEERDELKLQLEQGVDDIKQQLKLKEGG